MPEHQVTGPRIVIGQFEAELATGPFIVLVAADPDNWIHIDAPPERVWEFFTRPEQIVRWMGEYAVLEPRPGGEFTVNVKGAPVRGRYLELDPPHRLLLSWGYAGSGELPPGASTVEVRLVRDGTSTRVHLEHRDLPDPETPGHAEGWRHYLTRLAAAVTGDPGPDPGMRQVPRDQLKALKSKKLFIITAAVLRPQPPFPPRGDRQRGRIAP